MSYIRSRQSSWGKAGGTTAGDVFSLISSHPETNPDGIKQSKYVN